MRVNIKSVEVVSREHYLGESEPEVFDDEGFSFGRPPATGFRVMATCPDGSRYLHTAVVEDQNEADQLADSIERAGVINLTFWSQHYPVYGSSAYEAEVETAREHRLCGHDLSGHYLESVL